MRFFKRGARQTTPVAKNVSVTELLMRGDTARAAAVGPPTSLLLTLALGLVGHRTVSGPTGDPALEHRHQEEGGERHGRSGEDSRPHRWDFVLVAREDDQVAEPFASLDPWT